MKQWVCYHTHINHVMCAYGEWKDVPSHPVEAAMARHPSTPPIEDDLDKLRKTNEILLENYLDLRAELEETKRLTEDSVPREWLIEAEQTTEELKTQIMKVLNHDYMLTNVVQGNLERYFYKVGVDAVRDKLRLLVEPERKLMRRHHPSVWDRPLEEVDAPLLNGEP